MPMIASLSFIFLAINLSNWEFFIIMNLIIIGYIIGLYDFENLERTAKNYPAKKR
jgi:uncharacterized membrane protein